MVCTVLQIADLPMHQKILSRLIRAFHNFNRIKLVRLVVNSFVNFTIGTRVKLAQDFVFFHKEFV